MISLEAFNWLSTSARLAANKHAPSLHLHNFVDALFRLESWHTKKDQEASLELAKLITVSSGTLCLLIELESSAFEDTTYQHSFFNAF